MIPFSDDSRTGFELELLAPEGRSRFTLAEELARRFHGRVEHGFKYASAGRTPEGQPVCELSPAWRVVRPDGSVVASLVEDLTIREGVTASGPGVGTKLLMDDVRLAMWAESKSWVESPRFLLNALCSTFNGILDERVVRDPWGQALAVVVPSDAGRERVCEIVTSPLLRHERRDVVKALMEVALGQGFRIPVEAALHAHLDRGPWMETARLKRLILALSSEREALQAALQPNPRCTQVGPFPADVVRVATEAPDDLPFGAFCAALEMAGLKRALDFNLLGVVRKFPKHPTIEVRCLRMQENPDAMVDDVERVEQVIARCA